MSRIIFLTITERMTLLKYLWGSISHHAEIYQCLCIFHCTQLGGRATEMVYSIHLFLPLLSLLLSSSIYSSIFIKSFLFQVCFHCKLTVRPLLLQRTKITVQATFANTLPIFILFTFFFFLNSNNKMMVSSKLVKNEWRE